MNLRGGALSPNQPNYPIFPSGVQGIIVSRVYVYCYQNSIMGFQVVQALLLEKDGDRLIGEDQVSLGLGMKALAEMALYTKMYGGDNTEYMHASICKTYAKPVRK